MMRCVLDSNVLVSGLIKANGAPGRILAAYRGGLFELVTSSALIAELDQVLRRPHILRLIHATEATVAGLIEALQLAAFVVEPTTQLNVVERDPADNRVLEAAVTGHADFIVSGDQDLLTLGEYDRIPIVSPARFLAILSVEG